MGEDPDRMWDYYRKFRNLYAKKPAEKIEKAANPVHTFSLLEYRYPPKKPKMVLQFRSESLKFSVLRD